MARIRTIKPEFWTSEQVAGCELGARLLFIGIWNFADDHGVHTKSYQRLKMEIFPGDNCSIDDILSWINQLIAVGLIIEYAIEGKDYWYITGFNKHQRVDKPTYKFPLPDVSLISYREIVEHSTTIRRLGVYELDTASRPLADKSLTNPPRNGREWNVKDMEISKVPGETLPISPENSFFVVELFEYWKTVLNHPKAKLDKTRERKIIAAVQLKFSVAELKLAIDGCSKSNWHMGANDQKRKYDDISLIFRDAAKIEMFISFSSSSDNTRSIVSQIDHMAEGAI